MRRSNACGSCGPTRASSSAGGGRRRYPATFERHELEPGGTVTYFMTSPEGERFHGVWRVVAVDPPRSLDVEDSFADADGNVNPDMPTGQMHMRLTEEDGRTRMELISIHATNEEMQQVLDMGAGRGHEAGDRPDGRAARGVASAAYRRRPLETLPLEAEAGAVR